MSRFPVHKGSLGFTVIIPRFGGFVGGYAAYESPKSGYFHGDSHRACIKSLLIGRILSYNSTTEF